MLSRVAENLYWLARYLERAEDTARLISVNGHLLLDFPSAEKVDWDSLVVILEGEAAFAERYKKSTEQNVLNFLCGDLTFASSILSSLAFARENLRTTRDIMPREIWEEVNQLYLSTRDQVEKGITPRTRDAFLQRVIRSIQAVIGLIEGTLSNTRVKTFLTLGRQLERADMTTRIIDARSANLLPKTPEELTPFENLQWMSVLKSLTGYQMYRQHVRLRVKGPDVLRFLLQDTQFPRAVACSLSAFSEALQPLERRETVEHELADMRDALITARVYQLANEPQDLHAFVDNLQVGFNRVHSALAETYFQRR